MMVGIQFVISMAFTIMTPFLPLFIFNLGVHAPGPLDIWSGIVNSLPFIVAAAASPFWGAMADRRGRKLMVLRSAAAVSLFTGLMGTAQSVWQLVFWRTLMGAFAGFNAASIALVGSEAPDDQLGYALGWLQSGSLLGGVVGPLIGGVLADVFKSYRVVFYATAVLALLATLASGLLVHESYLPKAKAAAIRRPTLVGSFSALGPTVFVLLSILFMAQIGVRMVQPVITLFVRELVGPGPALATLAGVAFAVTGVGDLIGSPFLGKRSDQIGYRRVLLITVMGTAVFFIPQFFVTGIWTFIALRFGLGLFIGGIIPTANAMIGHLTPMSERGRVFGATASATFLGNFAGPLLGGVFAALWSIRTTFLISAALFALTWVWIWRRLPELRVPEAGPVSRSQPSRNSL